MRKFSVVNKRDGDVAYVEGEAALAKHLSIPVGDIPTVRMYKVTIGSFMIVEHLPKEESHV